MSPFPESVFDPSRLDGWFHLTVGDWNPACIPIGVLGYLVFVPLFWWAGPRGILWLIPLSSLALSWATLGAAYTMLLVTAVLVAWAVTYGVMRSIVKSGPEVPPGETHSGNRNVAVVLGCGVITCLYALLILRPQPDWLPERNPPLYFYVQWAGLSFLAFKTLAVLIDLRRGTISTGRSAEPGCPRLSFGRFVSFLLFAPTLRMGPIYRYQAFVTELEAAPTQRTVHALAVGFGRIALGLLRLGLVMVMVNQISAEQVFDSPQTLKTYRIFLGLYLQPLSIFMWIAGYSDVAVGIGRLCGFRVPENFNFPMLAGNIAEFWRRWHLTLSFWLRDYIYIPLGGNRKHVELNYVCTFLLVGLWHGLYPSYILWGLSQGVGLSVYRWWSRYWRRQREADGAGYRRLRRLGLAGGRLGGFLAWLLTVNYQLLTIALFMDEWHAGTRVVPELLKRFLPGAA